MPARAVVIVYLWGRKGGAKMTTFEKMFLCKTIPPKDSRHMYLCWLSMNFILMLEMNGGTNVIIISWEAWKSQKVKKVTLWSKKKVIQFASVGLPSTAQWLNIIPNKFHMVNFHSWSIGTFLNAPPQQFSETPLLPYLIQTTTNAATYPFPHKTT